MEQYPKSNRVGPTRNMLGPQIEEKNGRLFFQSYWFLARPMNLRLYNLKNIKYPSKHVKHPQIPHFFKFYNPNGEREKVQKWDNKLSKLYMDTSQ